MTAERLVVVGASLAGLRAVEAARRIGFAGEIVLIGAEQHPPYDRPPLSKDFLAAAQPEPHYLGTEESLRKDLDVQVMLGVPATALHADEQIVAAGDRDIAYTELVIATGARARELRAHPRCVDCTRCVRSTMRWLADGETLPADLVIVGVGAAPETGWLDGSGLKLDSGVVCDETLNAGPPGVYAAGDLACWPNPLFCEMMRLEHWTTAAEQGSVAARNAVNPAAARPCSTVPCFWSDWYCSRIQLVGIPHADEVQMVAGDADTDSFLALYRRGDRLVGALGLNQPRPVMKLRTMIGKHATWSDALALVRTAP